MQALPTMGATELAEGYSLDLANPLPSEPKDMTDLVKRVALSVR
jgi:hypothetical protein